MESYNYISKFDAIDVPIQIIKLDGSFFVYIGSPELFFDNLNVSMPDKEQKVFK